MDGVETGIRFNVQERQVDVLDPDSNLLLGHLTRSKIQVEIIEVQPQFSVARTFETYQAIDPDAPRSFLGFPGYVTKVKTLREERYPKPFEFREDSVHVEVGDLVIQAP